MVTVRKQTDLIVIHCSASPASGTHVDVKEIDRWHRKKGWLKIGYHYVITRDAVLQVGRKQQEVGAHVAGHNHRTLGVCLVGGTTHDWKTPEDNFTPQQKDVLYALLLRLRDEYPAARIVGHKDLDPRKTCPVMDLKAFLRERPGLS